jgi:hypothetical protein
MSGKGRLVYTPTANVGLNCPPEAFHFIVALGPTAWWCGGGLARGDRRGHIKAHPGSDLVYAASKAYFGSVVPAAQHRKSSRERRVRLASELGFQHRRPVRGDGNSSQANALQRDGDLRFLWQP